MPPPPFHPETKTPLSPCRLQAGGWGWRSWKVGRIRACEKRMENGHMNFSWQGGAAVHLPAAKGL